MFRSDQISPGAYFPTPRADGPAPDPGERGRRPPARRSACNGEGPAPSCGGLEALYPPNIEADVSAARLRRFIARQEDGSYRVKKEVRELIVFAEQDVVTDPPFTRLDLLSCRNLLIYFSPELQQRVLPVFQYSLLPGGVLFLGSAETVGSAPGLFATVDPRWKIYRRTGERAAYPEPFAVPYSRHPPEPAPAGRARGEILAERLQALLLRDYAAHVRR